MLLAEGRKADHAEKEEGELKKAARVRENCDEEASKIRKCSRRRLVRYCSQDCQLADWKKAQEDVQESGRAGEGREGGPSGGGSLCGADFGGAPVIALGEAK